MVKSGNFLQDREGGIVSKSGKFPLERETWEVYSSIYSIKYQILITKKLKNDNPHLPNKMKRHSLHSARSVYLPSLSILIYYLLYLVEVCFSCTSTSLYMCIVYHTLSHTLDALFGHTHTKQYWPYTKNTNTSSNTYIWMAIHRFLCSSIDIWVASTELYFVYISHIHTYIHECTCTYMIHIQQHYTTAVCA